MTHARVVAVVHLCHSSPAASAGSLRSTFCFARELGAKRRGGRRASFFFTSERERMGLECEENEMEEEGAEDAAEEGQQRPITRVVELVGTTTLLQEEGVKSGTVYISKCRDSDIYVLAPTCVVRIDRCTGCTIVLGPVRELITAEGCVTVNVVAVCSRIRVTSCGRSTFNLACRETPIFTGDDAESNFLAPYNTYYDCLEDHMIRTGLGDMAGSHALYSTLKSSERMIGASSSAHILPPERFEEIVIPFRSSSSTADMGNGSTQRTHANPIPLPPEYKRALKKKHIALAKLRQAINEAGLDESENMEVQRMLHAHFRAWLCRTGKMRQIEDLIAISNDEGAFL